MEVEIFWLSILEILLSSLISSLLFSCLSLLSSIFSFLLSSLQSGNVGTEGYKAPEIIEGKDYDGNNRRSLQRFRRNLW